MEGFDFVVGGFDEITRSFMPQLKDKIILKAKVSKIKQSTKGVSVHISCNGIECTDKKSGTSIEYDHPLFLLLPLMLNLMDKISNLLEMFKRF